MGRGTRCPVEPLLSPRRGARAQGYTSAAAFDDTLACRQSKAPAGVADRAPWQLHGREARHSVAMDRVAGTTFAHDVPMA